MRPGVLSGLTAAMPRGLGTAQAWPVSDSVTLAHWHATEPRGCCSWDPGVAGRALGRAPCSCPEAVGVCPQEGNVSPGSPARRAPSPSPCCQHPTRGAGLLPHLVLAYLAVLRAAGRMLKSPWSLRSAPCSRTDWLRDKRSGGESSDVAGLGSAH